MQCDICKTRLLTLDRCGTCVGRELRKSLPIKLPLSRVLWSQAGGGWRKQSLMEHHTNVVDGADNE